MGGQDKLRLRVGEKTILESAVSAAVNADIAKVLVVTGQHDYSDILSRYAVQSVANPDFEQGMSASIRAGIKACSPDALAYGILPADMPFIRSETINVLADSAALGRIVAPIYEGRQGHPVFFSAVYRNELLALDGDVGARSVINAHLENVLWVETDDEGVLRDVDSPADFGHYRAGPTE